MIRTLRRRLFRALLRRLALMMPRFPRAVCRIADVMAPVVFGPTVFATREQRRVAELFPELSPRTIGEVIHNARRVTMRNLILAESVRLRDLDALAMVDIPRAQLAALPHPLIVCTFHVGALPAVSAITAALPAPVLAVRRTPSVRPRPNTTFESSQGDEQQRARVFHRCLQFLRTGGCVFLPLDPSESVRVAAPFRGRTLQLARGPFALARITGAPLLPIVARWSGGRIEFEIGALIPAAEDEGALAAAAAAWLEQYLLRHPLEISERIVQLTH